MVYYTHVMVLYVCIYIGFLKVMVDNTKPADSAEGHKIVGVFIFGNFLRDIT